MRQELAAMGRSYDEKLDGQYIGNMGSVYKEGKGQVEALIWQYATADAKAEREANVNRIAENWGVSKETADNLYTAMAGIHTTAAIGGAVYGMKGSSSAAKGNTSVVESEKATLDKIGQNGKNSTAAASKLGNISTEANAKASLLKEMTSQGIKYTPENIVQVAKNADGKIVFLETGNSKAGLQHIIGEHAKDFANIGVSEAQIPSVVMKAVSEGKIVGYQGKGTSRLIYETVING